MKKWLIVFALIVLTLLSGCSASKGVRQEFYSKVDMLDYEDTVRAADFYERRSSVKLDILNIEQVSFATEYRKKLSSFGFFLFFGGSTTTTEEGTVFVNNYFCFLKNQRGAIFFARIPANLVRIYQDLKEGDSPCFIAVADDFYITNPERENVWNHYNYFNLHIKPGTIVPNIEDLDIDLVNFIPKQ